MKQIANLFIIFVLTGFVSCKKFVDVAPPQTQITTETVFSSDQTATTAVTGVYGKIMLSFGFLNGYMSLYPGLYADELEKVNPLSPDYTFFANNVSKYNAVLSAIWTSAYKYIVHANAIIQGIDKSTSLTPSVRSQLLGEARFLRALSFFYLTNLWGDVPLVLSTDYTISAVLPRTSTEKVYQQIIADLSEAKTLLTDDYAFMSAYPSARIRANKWAATALLARVYLYRKDWMKAESEATQVIGSGTYSLTADLNQVFLFSSNEAILQFIPVSQEYNSAEGGLFLPLNATAKPGCILAKSLMNSFEAGDLRKTNWTKTAMINGQSSTWPYKFKIYKKPPPYQEYNMVLRLAEQYLIRAEARAQQGNLLEALNDVKIIRARAGLSDLPASLTQAKILSAIGQERKIELFAEWGHRWFDLKRTGRADEVMGMAKAPNWQSRDSLWPIPDVEIQRNVHLVQNPGY